MMLARCPSRTMCIGDKATLNVWSAQHLTRTMQSCVLSNYPHSLQEENAAVQTIGIFSRSGQ
eukprot:scaffold399819_cov22-Prasinocladus_malaysianus.AAC.1